MERIGDDKAGFSVTFDPITNTVSVRAWGFWSVELANAFAKVVIDGCRGAPRGAALVMDMNELKPMRDEGQDSFAAVIKALPILGIASTTITTENQLTKLQLRRLTSQAGAKSSIQFA
jgi:hypothetical protein